MSFWGAFQTARDYFWSSERVEGQEEKVKAESKDMSAGWGPDDAAESLAKVHIGGGTSSQQQQPKAGAIELFKYDMVAGMWKLISASCEPEYYDENDDSETKAPLWRLEISEGNIDVPISDDLDLQLRSSECRVTFITSKGVWAIRFPSKERFSFFRKIYFDKLFENTYNCENTEANQRSVFGKDLAGKLFTEQSDPMDWEVSDDESEVAAPKKEGEQKTAQPTETPISAMQMGIGDRSYMFRGNHVDVFENKRGGVETKGTSFALNRIGDDAPSKLLLGNNETRMNILMEDRNSTLFHADIETGKVVSEWKFEKDGVEVPMADIATRCKGAQNEDDATLLSLDKNRLCRWDMRDPSGVVEDLSKDAVLDYVTGKDYSKGTNFSCMATAGDGSVAVGSSDGKVRLYNDNQKLTRASTAFPAVAAKVTALDVTFDGQWVVATTDKFIQVLKTSSKDDQGKIINGYKKSLGAKQPRPKLLRLKPEDQAVVGQHPFKNAKFTFVTEANRQERWIVASCGSYTILWNFRKVKLSKGDVTSHGGLTTVTDYHMIEKAEHVVDSAFMHDNYISRRGDPSLVVATDHHIYSTLEDDN
ncbi:hypothetical protein BSKO_00023 [Bryopsis sp. KO-2023]|nr:hypothetical protein BSKO_00023 [Bryopsis sp. KO-2023]